MVKILVHQLLKNIFKLEYVLHALPKKVVGSDVTVGKQGKEESQWNTDSQIGNTTEQLFCHGDIGKAYARCSGKSHQNCMQAYWEGRVYNALKIPGYMLYGCLLNNISRNIIWDNEVFASDYWVLSGSTIKMLTL